MTLLWLSVAHASSTPVVDRVAAVVNDEVVTLSDVYDLGRDFVVQRCPADVDPRCAAEAEREVLDALIRRVLVRQELARLEADVTTADVDRAIDQTVRKFQLADREALKTEVEASGRRWDQYRDELREVLRSQAFQGRVLAPRVTVTDDAVSDLYNRTARAVTKPVVTVSGLGIAVPSGATPAQAALAHAQAEALVSDLNTGRTSWDEAVARHDVLPSGMFAGRTFGPDELDGPLSDAVFAAPVGVVQPPLRVENPDGLTVLFVLRVDSKSEKSEIAPFEAVEAQLRDQAFAIALADAEEEWYQRARREAAVKVLPAG